MNDKSNEAKIADESTESEPKSPRLSLRRERVRTIRVSTGVQTGLGCHSFSSMA